MKTVRTEMYCNPILQRKISVITYTILTSLFGALYAAAFGAIIPLTVREAAVGGTALTIALGLEGMILWNIFKYGTKGVIGNLSRLIFFTTVGVMFVGVILCIESIAMSVTMDTDPVKFYRTIPAKALCLAMVYVLFALFYAYAVRSAEEREESISDNTQLSVSQNAECDPLERITIRTGQKITVVDVTDIIYIKAEGDYVAIATAEGRFLKEQTMKYLEENLPSNMFVRVHRSYIVAIPAISRIEQSGREHRVVLKEGTGIRISPTGYKILKYRLGL